MANAAIEPAEVFAKMRGHCLAKEGAIEENPWEHVAWKVGGKLFVIASQDSNVFTVKSTLEQQEALVQHPAIQKAAYVGRYGWVTITAEDETTMDIALDLADESYDAVRPKKRSRAAKLR